jgi:hypothetical protein
MKVVFLDIDGVLFPHYSKSWSAAAIGYLNSLCQEYGLQLVITSTWREKHSLEQLRELLGAQGVEGQIIGMTPIGDSRGEEIKEWLDNTQCEDYIVIDDVVWNIEPHVENVFKCQSHIGLNEEVYSEIKKRFEK